jgi:hypothetical protein
MNNAPRSTCICEETQYGKQIIAIFLRSAKRNLVSLESRVNQPRSNAIREAAHLAADEARRDRKSRNADRCEEACGKDQSLRRCSRANCSAVKGRVISLQDRRIVEDVAAAEATTIVRLFRFKVKGK